MYKTIKNPDVLKEILISCFNDCTAVALSMGLDINSVHNHYFESSDFKIGGKPYGHSLYSYYKIEIECEYIHLFSGIDEKTDIYDYCKKSLNTLMKKNFFKTSKSTPQYLSHLFILTKALKKETLNTALNLRDKQKDFEQQNAANLDLVVKHNAVLEKQVAFLLHSGYILENILLQEIAKSVNSDPEQFNNFMLFLYCQICTENRINFFDHLHRRLPLEVAMLHSNLDPKLLELDRSIDSFARHAPQDQRKYDNLMIDLNKCFNNKTKLKNFLSRPPFTEPWERKNEPFARLDIDVIMQFLFTSYFSELDKKLYLAQNANKDESIKKEIDIFANVFIITESEKPFNKFFAPLCQYYPHLLSSQVNLSDTLNTAKKIKPLLSPGDKFIMAIEQMQDALTPLVQKEQLEHAISPLVPDQADKIKKRQQVL